MTDTTTKGERRQLYEGAGCFFLLIGIAAVIVAMSFPYSTYFNCP